MKIPIAEPNISKKDIQAVRDCMESGWISSAGPEISKFASSFSQEIGVKYGLPVSTGTAALHLALLTLGIKPGDEVILPALTFVSPASMVKTVGAEPVFADLAPDSFTVNPAEIEKKITPRTKAIIAVHLYGYPVDLQPILNIAKKYSLQLIEDCAEALGATYQEKIVGSFGDIACFSFYANKFITTGEGGMLTTNSAKLYYLAQLLCDHGMTKEKRYYHKKVGFNYRLTAMQAALGISQLEKIDKILLIREKILKKYSDGLKDIPQIEWCKPLPQTKPVCWLATPLLPNKKIRNALQKYLAEKLIETRKVFYPIPGMPPYPTKAKFPFAQNISERGLSLPTYTHLTRIQIQFICFQIKKFFTNKKI